MSDSSSLSELETVLEQKLEAKRAKKAYLKNWVIDFEKENGRSPTKEDKDEIRDSFEAYKDLAEECKQLTAQIEDKKRSSEEETSTKTISSPRSPINVEKLMRIRMLNERMKRVMQEF